MAPFGDVFRFLVIWAVFCSARNAATELLTRRNAVLACIEAYNWSWAVANAHVEAVNILYARKQVPGRITRTRTGLSQPRIPLDTDVEELVSNG